MDYWQLILLGSIAGFTIFLGLPLAVLQNLSTKKKAFLNAFAIGILVFLIIDVFSHAWESAETVASDAFAGKSPIGDVIFDLLAMFGGIAIGLLGLLWYESKYMKKPIKQQQQQLSSKSSAAEGESILSNSASRIAAGGAELTEHQHQQQQQQQKYLW